jgi:hypothetical protein
MKTRSLLAFDADSLETQLLSLLKDHFYPTLGIVFCSPMQDIQSIMGIFKQYNIELVGCTSAGEIVNDELHETAIACTLMELPRQYYKTTLVSGKPLYNELMLAQEVRAFADEQFEDPALIVLTSGLYNDGEKIILGLKNQREIPIFGGMAGDDLLLKDTFVFNNEIVSEKGIIAIALDSQKIEVNGLATSGWQTIGATHVITKASGSLVETINDQPALDYFLKFFGYFDAANVKGKSVSTISAQYPFQLERENGGAVLRVPLQVVESERAIHLTGSVKNGDKFRFSISPGIEVAEKTISEFEQLKQKMNAPDAILLFSCKGRHAALGPFLDDEVKGIYEHWQKPMVGFLSYGEFGNLKNGICEFHNETCCLVTLRVKA